MKPFAVFVAGLGLGALAVPALAFQPDAQIRQRLIQESIAAYPGPCPCPYSRARNGSQCGRRSAYSRPGATRLCATPATSRPRRLPNGAAIIDSRANSSAWLYSDQKPPHTLRRARLDYQAVMQVASKGVIGSAVMRPHRVLRSLWRRLRHRHGRGKRRYLGGASSSHGRLNPGRDRGGSAHNEATQDDRETPADLDALGEHQHSHPGDRRYGNRSGRSSKRGVLSQVTAAIRLLDPAASESDW